MKPIVYNNCSMSYRTDCEKIVTQIIKRIPGKFLVGLMEVRLICEEIGQTGRMEYTLGKRGKPSIITIRVDTEDYNKYPFFSIISLNMDFILKVNQHVEESIKPKSNDPDIKAFNRSRINLNWMYMGFWSPIFLIFKLFIYPIQKGKYLRNLIFKLSDKVKN